MVPTMRSHTQDAQGPQLGSCADAATLPQTTLPVAHMWHAESLDEPCDAASRRSSYAMESGTPPALYGGQLHSLAASNVLTPRACEADYTCGGAHDSVPPACHPSALGAVTHDHTRYRHVTRCEEGKVALVGEASHVTCDDALRSLRAGALARGSATMADRAVYTSAAGTAGAFAHPLPYASALQPLLAMERRVPYDSERAQRAQLAGVDTSNGRVVTLTASSAARETARVEAERKEALRAHVEPCARQDEASPRQSPRVSHAATHDVANGAHRADPRSSHPVSRSPGTSA